MRQPVRPNPNRIPKGRTTTLPAPVHGWFAKESLADADPQSAVVLDNMFPEAETIRARRGRTLHVSGLGNPVESLLPYIGADATARLFAAAGGSIWNVTDDADPMTDPADITGMNNDRWQHTMFATAGGQFLYIVNGEDDARYFDGTTWTVPTITGATSSTFVSVWAHKSRLWFAVANSTDLYYLDTDSIAGPANIFPVGAFFAEGGYVMAGSTWSPADAGDGMDNLMVVYSSEGEVLVYGGDDPATDFFLLQRYRTGDPLGRRCMFQVGGDLLLINELGLIPMSSLAKLDLAASEAKSLARNIRAAYSEAVQFARDEFGWQIVSFPLRNMAILNVPGQLGEKATQFVFNTTTGAWGRYIGWDARCWAHFNNHPLNDNLMFGDGDGNVWHAENGGDDAGVSTSDPVIEPAAIPCVCVPAFSQLGLPGRLKHVVACRPITQTDIDQVPSIAIAVDYEIIEPTASAALGPQHWFTWDVSNWDEDDWRGEEVNRPWLGVGNIGTAIAPVMKVEIDASNVGSDFDFRLIAFDLIFEAGGVI